nr:ABC transporter ATP-binding protein [Ardenticatena sp.]
MRVDLIEVSKTFTGEHEAAVGPMTLHIPSGQFVALVGPSGCGKSTLLRLIADQFPPTSGKVLLDGRPPREARRQKAIAWMAQQPALFPWATVLDNVRLPLRVNPGANRSSPDPETLLEMVGLSEYANASPQTLSGGQQQRVALARTLATGTRLWLMDEPFAALDELTRERLSEDLLRMWETFRPTVLWVTHNVPEAVRLAERVVVLSKRPGRVRADIPVVLPSPRDETMPEVANVVRHIRQVLRSTE